MLRRLATVVALLATGLAATVATEQAAGAVVPAGFSDQAVVSVASPTALAFLPDGRMLVTTQPGRLLVVQDGAVVATAIDLTGSTCSNSERGLLGVAVDPAFATTHPFVYVYRTVNKNAGTTLAARCVNQVVRLAMSGNTATLQTPPLLDEIPSTGGNHNAGDLQFGKDGLLYVSIGDAGCDYAGDSGCAGSNDAARDQNVLLGKIARITRDGGIPAGNPFQGTGTGRCNTSGRTTAARCQETFAWGLRNPFRMAFDPNATGTRFHINDVGQNQVEEIDLGQAGADYGWNCREGTLVNSTSGRCNPTPPNMVPPIFQYGRSDGCVSITGGAFVPNNIGWPADYAGKYLFADYGCGKIFRLDPSGTGGFTRTDFVTALGTSSAVHLAFGPPGAAQALYYTSYNGGGQVRRITFEGTNAAPTGSFTATPRSGPAPLDVSFDASASTDPDGDALTYVWNFGDGAPALRTTSPTTTHPYNANGQYTATLTVEDGRGGVSSPVTTTITVGNRAPTASITSPAAGALFSVGQSLTLTGSATDAEDGNLAASRLSWTVLRHHENHTHPYFGPTTGNNLTVTGPPPEDLAAVDNSFIEVILTATDSAGVTTTVSRTVQPRKVLLKFATKPTGLNVIAAGVTLVGPTKVTSWVGWSFEISAPSPQGNRRFKKWSDGGAQTHTITTPSSAITYKAVFR